MSGPATLDEWADRYGRLLDANAHAAGAWIGIPVLVASLFGLLWSLPLPAALDQDPPIVNWATMLLMASFVYYCILSIPIALAGLVFLAAATAPCVWFEMKGLPTWPVAIGAFVPAFAWQLTMTRRATGRVCVIRNLQYLMLGPLWLLRALFRRFSLGY